MQFKILIAEDEIPFRDILVTIVELTFQKYFSTINVKISVASNGQEEVQIAKKEPQDIIITDINMPVMDGMEAVKQIRVFDKSVPILALTALTATKDVTKIIQSGVSNYTAKPLNRKLFIAQLLAFVNIYLKNQFQYNKNTINLISKKIFKRKTVFLIENVDDLFEFWEYILELDTIDEDNIQNTLQDLYSLEEKMIRKGIVNEIILEEDTTSYYATLSNISSELLSNYESKYKCNANFLSFEIVKKDFCQESCEEVIPQEFRQTLSPVKTLQEEINEARKKDLNYEKVSAEMLISELDPSMEDKIENFDEDLELLRVAIYNFEISDEEDLQLYLKEIIASLYEFNDIVSMIGLFHALTKTFYHFISFLENIDDAILHDLQKRIFLATVLKALAKDFEQWIVSLFVEKSASDIHYLDASLMANCLNVQVILLDAEQSSDDDDSVEFF